MSQFYSERFAECLRVRRVVGVVGLHDFKSLATRQVSARLCFFLSFQISLLLCLSDEAESGLVPHLKKD